MTGSSVLSHNSAADGRGDLTSEGNADSTAVAGAAGTDITASTDYGSRKSPDGAEDVRFQYCSGASSMRLFSPFGAHSVHP